MEVLAKGRPVFSFQKVLRQQGKVNQLPAQGSLFRFVLRIEQLADQPVIAIDHQVIAVGHIPHETVSPSHSRHIFHTPHEFRLGNHDRQIVGPQAFK